MTARPGAEGLAATLDAVGGRGGTVDLWWRDDDLERPSLELDALLEELGSIGVSPALAAVPGRLVPEAVASLASSPARLLPHGWLHADHARPGSRKSEFGPERSVEIRLGEIADGRRRLAVLAGDRALPCLVPPWNRIGDDLLDRLGGAGIVALSGFAPWRRRPAPAGIPRLDTHVDLIDWRGGRVALDADAVAAALEQRIGGGTGDRHESRVDGPIGILSHHRVTDPAAWRAWRPLLAALSAHPAVRWLDPASALATVWAGPPVAPAAGNETRRTG